ncbi:flagellar basal body rod protein FlgB [Clostridium sp. YIM B02551]|uniref:flagellar basal body rod protein FlgB n=1 Tax=Clostridium sp. YIM B02551 TaxID=2910679 RepID=UPI001EECDBE0|nr:flagellar basal body rod protein FlgB [Clostridium sp. YIM B02551]
MEGIMENNLNVSSDYSYNLLKDGLKAASLRGKVISNNIANINTRGFKRSYVNFEDKFQQSLSDIGLKTTNSKHIPGENSGEGPDVVKDESTSMRLDGNNVDLDIEKSNQAANTMMYNALVTSANNKLNNTKYVITSGGR